MGTRHPAWESGTLPGVGHLREELPVEASYGQINRISLPATSTPHPGHRLKQGQGVHGGSGKEVEPETVHVLLSTEERGGTS